MTCNRKLRRRLTVWYIYLAIISSESAGSVGDGLLVALNCTFQLYCSAVSLQQVVGQGSGGWRPADEVASSEAAWRANQLQRWGRAGMTTPTPRDCGGWGTGHRSSVDCRAANDWSVVTITKKDPTRAISWSKVPTAVESLYRCFHI